MKKALAILWLVIPVGILTFHFGPGQELLARDRASGHLDRATDAFGSLEYADAAGEFSSAALELPDDPTGGLERMRLELASAVSMVRDGKIIQGQEKLETLLAQIEPTEHRDSELARCIRNELATASYFAAWIMRLEGATPEEWLPEAERARQQFRLVAERAADAGDADESHRFKKNLEATIRLQRMSLEELLALPLPKNCPCNCENLSQRKRKQCKSKCKGKKEGDAREKIKPSGGAGLNRREGSGS